MVYFSSKKPDSDTISQAVAWAKQEDISIVEVQSSLTYMWGCGGGCRSTSALVDVDSDLARLKFGLMDHFSQLGMGVERTAWGGTAHVQVVW